MSEEGAIEDKEAIMEEDIILNIGIIPQEDRKLIEAINRLDILILIVVNHIEGKERKDMLKQDIKTNTIEMADTIELLFISKEEDKTIIISHQGIPIANVTFITMTMNLVELLEDLRIKDQCFKTILGVNR